MDKPIRERKDPAELNEIDIQAECMSRAMPGVITAGAIYSLLPSGIILLGSGPNSIEIAFAAVFIGFIVSAVSVLISAAIIFLFNRSMGYPLDGISAAISAGSMAGYLPTIFLAATAPSMFFILAFLLGPLLAMTLGAIGANIALRKFAIIDLDRIQRARWRLSVSRLMAITFWIALTLAIANLFHVRVAFVIVVLIWIAINGTTLGLFRLFWWAKKKARRKTKRKTKRETKRDAKGETKSNP